MLSGNRRRRGKRSSRQWVRVKYERSKSSRRSPRRQVLATQISTLSPKPCPTTREFRVEPHASSMKPAAAGQCTSSRAASFKQAKARSKLSFRLMIVPVGNVCAPRQTAIDDSPTACPACGESLGNMQVQVPIAPPGVGSERSRGAARPRGDNIPASYSLANESLTGSSPSSGGVPPTSRWSTTGRPAGSHNRRQSVATGQSHVATTAPTPGIPLTSSGRSFPS